MIKKIINNLLPISSRCKTKVTGSSTTDGLIKNSKQMNVQITSGIKVSVKAVYQPEYSNPDNMHFMFSYQITIENVGDITVQLVNRHWNIFDSIGEFKQVEGEGVVGEQPILIPGTVYQYVSGCNLKSEVGYMEGYYEMRSEIAQGYFQVEIPRFNLIASYKLN